MFNTLDYLDVVKEPDFEHTDYETKLYDKNLNMSFLCDGIIRYKDKYYILELKTEASFKFNSRSDVDPKHHNQGTAYSHEFGIDDVIFIYINRDILDMKPYMTFDELFKGIPFTLIPLQTFDRCLPQVTDVCYCHRTIVSKSRHAWLHSVMSWDIQHCTKQEYEAMIFTAT